VGADPDVSDLPDVAFHVFFPAVKVLLLFSEKKTPRI
jgi:hypothetical protein